MSVFRTFAIAALVTLSATVMAVEPGEPSKTSLHIAILRAAGAGHPDPARRNPDDLAGRFIGESERAAFRAALRILPNLPPEVSNLAWPELIRRIATQESLDRQTARTKYFDDALLHALRSGVRQVVILGAGFDTRAYRFQQQLAGVRFFEVDYGPTQEYKKRRLRGIFGRVPAHVGFVAMDFTRDELFAELRKAGYSERLPTIFLWEGVVPYLPEAAVKDTLRFVRDRSAGGSILVFNYPLSRSGGVNNRQTWQAMWGEPWVFGMPGESAGPFLASEGLQVESDVSIRDLLERYTLPAQNSGDEYMSRFCIARTPAR